MIISHSKSYQAIIVLVAIGILGASAYGTYQRNDVWHSEESLWYDVTIKSPENTRGLLNYGRTQSLKGDYNRALKYFEKGLEIDPNYNYLHINMGVLKATMNRPLEAERHFKSAIYYGSNYPDSYYYYGRWLYEQGRLQEAIFNLLTTLKLSEAYMDARHLLMSIYSQQYEWKKLTELAKQTLKILPDDPTTKKYLEDGNKYRKTGLEIAEKLVGTSPTPENFLNLSLNYYRAGMYKRCIETCKIALELRPDYAEAYNNICSAYNQLENWNEAIKACEQSLQILPDYQLAKNNLAWAEKQKMESANHN